MTDKHQIGFACLSPLRHIVCQSPTSYRSSKRHHFHRAAGGQNLLPGAFGETVSLDGKGPIQLAAPQDDHRLAWRFDDAYLGQGSRANLVSCSEIIQPVKVDRSVIHLKDIGEASLLGQAPHQRQLAAFEVGAHAPAPARAFWPLVPRPAVLPWPAAIPRPTRFLFFLAPLAGRNSCNFIPCLHQYPISSS